MNTPWPYQSSFIEDIRQMCVRYNHVLACAATGSGKTTVFSNIAWRAHERGRPVLILTESTKIYTQLQEEIPAILIDPDQDKDRYLPPTEIFIAMVQTLARREALMKQLQLFGKNLLIIVDECHMGTFNKVLERLSEAVIIGFTATPDARFAKHLPKIYKGFVLGPQPEELIRLSYLMPYRHFARVSADLNKLSIQKGDFSEESQESVFEEKKVFDNLVQDLNTFPYTKCLIFCASIKDCELEYNRLIHAGFNVVRVHSKMDPKEESYSLGQFRMMDSGINICLSVGSMTKGFDFRPIDLIVLRRATMSTIVYFQMCGRGSRLSPETNKKHFTVLDYGGNYQRHGLWDAEVDWADLWNKPSKPRNGVAPVKLCPNCDYISNASAQSCPNCGYEFSKKDISVEVGQLIEITEKYTAMQGKRTIELTPEELSVYAKLKNKKNLAMRIAKFLDVRKPGYLDQYAAAMEYRPNWAMHQREIFHQEISIHPDHTCPDFILK